MSVAVEAPPRETVPTAPFRERYYKLHQRGEINSDVVAERLEWYDSKGKPEGSRVLRSLGIAKDKRGLKESKRLDYRNAVRFCRALDLDPFEVGI